MAEKSTAGESNCEFAGVDIHDPNVKIDALQALTDEIFAELLGAGFDIERVRAWQNEVTAIVCGRPDLFTVGGQIADEAERILRFAE